MTLLKETLHKIENQNVEEFKIYQELLKVSDLKNALETEYEQLAFSIFESNTIISEFIGFSEYEVGKIIDREDLDKFITYIHKRSEITKNPILKLRYSKLFLEFISKAKNIKFDINVVNTLVSSVKSIAKLIDNPFKLHTIMYQLSYTVKISLRFNQTKYIQELKDVILNFCNRIDLLENQGVWYTIYIVLLKNKKEVQLTDVESDKILQFLQKVLDLEKHPYEIVRISSFICEYFKKQNDIKIIKSTLDKAFSRLLSNKSSGISFINLLLSFQSVVKNFKYATLESEITKKIEETGDLVKSEMSLVNITIPSEIQEKFTKWQNEEKEHIKNLLTIKSFDEILISIFWNYIPRKADIQKDKVKNASLFERIPGIVSEMKVDEDGIPVTTSTGLENEDSLLVKWLISRYFPIYDKLLYYTVFTLFSESSNSCESITAVIKKSNIFSEFNKMILTKGIKAFFDKDFIVAIHLFIPQIEDIIRKIFALNGGNTRRPNKYGGLDKILLHSILDDEILLASLGEDLILYLKSILTHRLGYNVRNQLCHGLLKDFNPMISLRLLHIVTLLSLIIVQEDE